MIDRKIPLIFLLSLLFIFNVGVQSCESNSAKLAKEKEQFMLTQSNRPLVEITLTDQHFQRPPLVNLFFTITLRNESSQPSWFILPSKLNLPTVPLKNGVDGVIVFKLKGQGEVIVGRFQGTGGFQALRLPANSEVTLRDFPIGFWGQLPEKSIPLEVIIADELTVGDQPAQEWFQDNPMSDRQANVSFSQSERLSSKYTPDRKEVAVSVRRETRLSLNVKLTKE